MFNKYPKTLKKIGFFIIVMLIFSACNKDEKLTFEKQHIDKSQDAKIVINYPKAIGNKDVAKKINYAIEGSIAYEINMTESLEEEVSLSEVVSRFDSEYKKFKNDFKDSNQKWEVKVDGDVVYESDEVICINIKSYTDTGGAHGNSTTTYLNFNPQTGAILWLDDIFNNVYEFKKIAEKAFKDQSKPKDNAETMEDFFYGELFQLPTNMGFTKDGLVLVYNNYEIASYAQGNTKIVLPYSEIKDLLKVNP